MRTNESFGLTGRLLRFMLILLVLAIGLRVAAWLVEPLIHYLFVALFLVFAVSLLTGIVRR